MGAVLKGKRIRDKEIKGRFNEYVRDMTWIRDNYKRLVSEYPDQYIAIKNEEVVATADSMKTLVEQLDDIGKYAIQFISTEERICIL